MGSLSKGFPGGSDGRESACNAGDQGLIPGSGRPPGEGNSNPLKYSCLKNSMDRGAWRATVHGVTKSQIWLSDLITLPLFASLSKEKEIMGIVGPLMDQNLVVWSRWWVSERSKEANIPWVTQPASALQGIKIERKTDRQTRGPKLWWSKGVLINMAWAYIL